MTPHEPATLALTGDQPIIAFYPRVQYLHTHPNIASGVNTISNLSDTSIIHNRWVPAPPKNNLTFNWRLIKAPISLSTRHRSRTHAPDRAQSHAKILEHHCRPDRADGEGEGLVEGAW